MNIVTAGIVADLVATALTGATGAGANVYSPRTWPSTPSDAPQIFVQTPGEVKENQAGRTGPAEFYTVATIRVIGRLTSILTADLDAAANVMEGALGILQRQIEIAVINADPIQRATQKLISVTVQTATKTDGAGVEGQLSMDFAFEFYQGPEAFAPVASDPIDEFAIYADLINIYSPTDTFVGLEPFDAATDPPRTSGPDGRPEGSILISFMTPPPSDAGDLDFDADGNVIHTTI